MSKKPTVKDKIKMLRLSILIQSLGWDEARKVIAEERLEREQAEARKRAKK